MSTLNQTESKSELQPHISKNKRKKKFLARWDTSAWDTQFLPELFYLTSLCFFSEDFLIRRAKERGFLSSSYPDIHLQEIELTILQSAWTKAQLSYISSEWSEILLSKYQNSCGFILFCFSCRVKKCFILNRENKFCLNEK